METNKNGEWNQDDSHRQSKKTEDDADLHIDKNASGKDIGEEGRESRHHQQEHGNRKYESYTNHSSADDQPQVNTDLNPGRGR